MVLKDRIGFFEYQKVKRIIKPNFCLTDVEILHYFKGIAVKVGAIIFKIPTEIEKQEIIIS